MLTIRLFRIGKKNKPTYRLIISEKNKDTRAPALETLGAYNPYNKELQANGERIKYWLSKGAQMSPTVNNLLLDKAIITGEKVKASSPGTKKKDIAEAKSAEVKPETAPEVAPVEAAPAETAPEVKIEVASAEAKPETAPVEVAPEAKPAEAIPVEAKPEIKPEAM